MKPGSEEYKARARGYYQKSRDAAVARARRGNEKRKAKRDALKDRPCADCAVKYAPHIMQFDHVRGTKKFNIGRTAMRGAWGEILAEVAKCDLVCANCHAERTHQRGQYDSASRRKGTRVTDARTQTSNHVDNPA